MTKKNFQADLQQDVWPSSGVGAESPDRIVAPTVLATAGSPGRAVDRRLAAPNAVIQAALNDNRATDEVLDQYYTDENVARFLYRTFIEHFDPTTFLMVEPSAGTGSFFKLLPAGSLAFDVDPKYPKIETADFLSVEIESVRRIAVIGNPPFGKNSSLAVRFFKHAARQAEVIAFILPRTFRKASILRRLNCHFHLLREVTVPDDAFLFRGKPFNVPAVFQIWERREVPRELPRIETEHPDFEFTVPSNAHFAIQRVGANAGQVHHRFELSIKAHYFIRANFPGVEAVMEQLDLAAPAANSAGNPSLAMSEIVALYREWIEGTPAKWRLPCGSKG